MHLGLMILTLIIILLMLVYLSGIFLTLISPTVLQIQLLGIQLTMFGAVILLAYNEAGGYGLTIGIAGLITGIVGSLRDKNTSKNN
ncbi:hypothetical protein [Paenibacillus sp. ATY16]|uniref:hypothetical protein n=1 Tax=Paenibacillus sp. ATY16 TaxID=1759312 RepID=UPI00200D60D3|nr:hypothetical protein [Paenibacillus sp. ATY16]